MKLTDLFHGVGHDPSPTFAETLANPPPRPTVEEFRALWAEIQADDDRRAADGPLHMVSPKQAAEMRRMGLIR